MFTAPTCGAPDVVKWPVQNDKYPAGACNLMGVSLESRRVACSCHNSKICGCHATRKQNKHNVEVGSYINNANTLFL